MNKRFMAAVLGAHGGISSNATSGPCDSREEAINWARENFNLAKNGKMGIFTMTDLVEPSSPPIVVTPLDGRAPAVA